MKKITLRIISFIICAVMVVGLVGCGQTVEVDFESIMPKTKPSSDLTVAENSNYILTWNNDEKCVVLTDKASGVRWSTTPVSHMDLDDSEKQARARNYLESAILVSYKVPDEESVAQVRAYTHSINKGTYAAEIENGVITVTHYFKDAEALVPVQYSLNENGFSMAVDASKIVEGNNPIYSIDIAPYLCSVPHGTEDSYIFYPSGSGAIIDTVEKVLEQASYTAEVYGADNARKIKHKLTNEKNVYLPVYGIKNGDNALMAVISNGAESASITTTVLDTATNYSTVYSSFNLRGNDYTFIKGSGGTDATLYADERITDTIFKVDFYPLSGEDANYSGMAKAYQKILFGDNNAAGVTDPVYSLRFVGGLLETEDIIGFPYDTLLELTTYNDVKNILNDLSSTGVKPNIQLYGFGASGMTVDKVAGGFKLGSGFGTADELKSLTEYCNQNGIDSYVDFNLSEFKKSSGGYSTFNTAKTATKMSAYVYKISKGAQILDVNNYDRHRLISRTKLDSIANKLLGKIEKYGISGVSFESITANAYSDYTSSDYYVKANMGSQVAAIVQTYKNNNYKFAASGANQYAAIIADCIFNAPGESAALEMFTTDVPFYQMVFKGKIELTTESLNAATSYNNKKLSALETGTSMLFTIFNENDLVATFSEFKGLYGGVYSGNRDNLIALANEYGDYYAAVADQTIVNHQLLTEDVRCTTYSNGVMVYVNYGEADYETPNGVVKATDCLVIK